MLARSLYRLGLLVLFPVSIAIHGAYWITSTTSFAISVYAMKLVFLPFLIICLVENISTILNERRLLWYTTLFSILFVLSMMTPFITGKGTNFYYYSDMFGLALTIVSIPALYAALKNNKLSLPFIEKTSVQYLIIISTYIILFYLISGGMKISITPEMQIPMAVMFGAYFFGSKESSRPSLWIFLLVLIACILSQLRENLIAFILLTTICLMRKRIWARWILGGIGSLALTQFVIFNFSEIIEIFDTISTGQVLGILDGSIMQRFVEVYLVFEEMEKNPFSLYIGQGFGATYENIDGKLEFYGNQVHNIHSTPVAVYLRNGLYGFTLYFSVLTLACITIFSKNHLVFRTSLCVVIMYATLFFNQYLYWNVQFGLIAAMWLYSKHRKGSSV